MLREIAKGTMVRIVAGILALLIFVPTGVNAQSDTNEKYPNMAPIDEYLMNRDAEIALARSAAPASISDGATVMVLGRQGYSTAVPGTNGFLCYVERSWAKSTSAPDFWNPKMRAPNCFNQAAAKSVGQAYLMKTRLVLEGKSKAEINQSIAAALDSGELPALPPGGMCYMMSKEQYLNDQAKNWHPHVMFYVKGDVPKSWGANLDGSPMIAVYSADARATIFMVVVSHWSDGTLGPS
ncbi:MAG TPA: hypothetical protein VJN21_15220 [Candidatus Acidoferrales bacterium]|nr:hypothetical protein [Candidatus Acidoferrales bacterium]